MQHPQVIDMEMQRKKSKQSPVPKLKLLLVTQSTNGAVVPHAVGAPGAGARHRSELLHAQAYADPSHPTLTLWWYQDFAVDGTPANGVNIHCAQIAPEVMTSIILKALIPQKGPVSCQDRADNQRH